MLGIMKNTNFNCNREITNCGIWLQSELGGEWLCMCVGGWESRKAEEALREALPLWLIKVTDDSSAFAVFS